LFALEGVIGDEVDLAAEAGDNGAFFVPMADAFGFVWVLTGVEAAVGL